MVRECSEQVSDDESKRALDFEVFGRRGRAKMTWREQGEEEIKEIWLEKEDTINIVK